MRSIEVIAKICGFVLGFIYLFFFFGNEWFQWACFGFILLTVGIPHGAIDHLLSNSNKQDLSLITFVFRYLAIIILYLIVWLTMPVLALVAFLIMSAYHFGQSHFIKFKLLKYERLTYLMVGTFILSVIFWSDFESTASIISAIASIDGLADYGKTIILSNFLISSLLIIVNLKNKGLWLCLEIGALGIFLFHLPLLLGFIIYFGFWHAIPSMKEEFMAIEGLVEISRVKNFLKKLLPFTLISVGGIILILALFQNLLAQNQLTLLFFILVSLISAPHIWYMNLFLDSRKSQY